jgi:acylglycerol lipase
MQARQKTLTMKDGVELQAKIHEMGSDCWIIVTHGIGEHMERHNYIVDLFGMNFNILQYDLRGHGRSYGERAWIESFDTFMEDLDQIVDFLKNQYKMKKYVLFGHSMGALITAAYIQGHADKNFYPQRVILNAPPVGYHGFLGDIVRMGPTGIFRTLAKMKAGTALAGLVDLNYLSHDVHVKDKYVQDPLNCLKLHTKLVLGMVETSKRVFARPLRPECPLYVSYGSDDKIVGVKDLKNYFTFVEKAVSLTEFTGAYHEIHNEIEKYRKPYFDYLRKTFEQVLYPES